MDKNYMTLDTLQLSADLKANNYVELLNHHYRGFPFPSLDFLLLFYREKK